MTLEELRSQIDEIDQKLFALLKERLQVVEKVGHLKKSTVSNKYIIRAGREAAKVRKAYQTANNAGFDKKTSLAFVSLWRELISLSINFEDETKIAYNTKDPETLWKLREYLGSYTTKTGFSSDVEVMSSLKSRSVNIAAFTVEKNPSAEPWWMMLKDQTEFSVFAETPLFKSDNKNSNSTLLVSNVTPEPSGEDKFVYIFFEKLPGGISDNFEVISEYKGNYLVTCEEFYNNYQSDLKAKYIGCFAIFDF